MMKRVSTTEFTERTELAKLAWLDEAESERELPRLNGFF